MGTFTEDTMYEVSFEVDVGFGDTVSFTAKRRAPSEQAALMEVIEECVADGAEATNIEVTEAD